MLFFSDYDEVHCNLLVMSSKPWFSVFKENISFLYPMKLKISNECEKTQFRGLVFDSFKNFRPKIVRSKFMLPKKLILFE